MIYLGVDCGTQSTKALALDGETGNVLAVASQSYDVLPGPPGQMEQHPQIWLEAMDETVRNVLNSLRERRSEVRALAVSGQQHGFVPIDAEGRVIRPAKLWCDTTTTTECDLFRSHFGSARVLIEETGLDMLPGYTAPKILWLKRREPENFARLSEVMLPHDYLNFYLSGESRMEYGDASGTALMNVRTRKWSEAVLKFIDPALGDKLPELGTSRGIIGELRPELAQRWDLPKNVKVAAGGGDNMMSAIGTGNVSAGRVTASLGTSGTIFAYSETPVIDTLGEIAGFCDSTDAWLPLVCTMNVTVATEAVRALFGWSHLRMEEALRSVPPGSDGLLFLPYLTGERTPNLPRGTGSFHGLTPRNMTSAHLARATMEGATLGLAYGLMRLRTVGVVPTEIRLTGGGSKSAGWRQICANIFGCPVTTPYEAEGAALGAAIQALASVQTEKSVNTWADELVRINEAETIVPQANLDFDYAAALQKHTALTRALAGDGFL